jgi:hypothetical protein
MIHAVKDQNMLETEDDLISILNYQLARKKINYVACTARSRPAKKFFSCGHRFSLAVSAG